MLLAVCPFCRTGLRAADSADGAAMKCPRCGKAFLLRAALPAYDVVLNEDDVEVVDDPAEKERVRGEDQLEVACEPGDEWDKDGPIIQESDPLDDEDATERAKQRIYNELDEGEIIVWVGRPSLRLLPKRIGTALPFGVLIFITGLFSLPGMLRVLLDGGFSRNTLLVCAGLGCFGLFWCALGALVCAHSLGLYLIRLVPSVRAIYVLTNRRAMCFGILWNIRRYYPADAARMRVREAPPYDGGGDLIFEYVDAVHQEHRAVRFVQEPRGFLWVENVHKVKRLVRKTLRERRA